MIARSQRRPGSSALPFQNLTRLELLDVFSVRASDIRELKNHIGTMHGGMLYALGEVAAAVAMTQLLVQERDTLYAITRRVKARSLT